MSAAIPDSLVFQLGIVPDIAGIRLIYDLDPALSDGDVAEYAFQRQRAAQGNDELPPHLLRIVQISCVSCINGEIEALSFTADHGDERKLIERFAVWVGSVNVALHCWGNWSQQLSVLRCRAAIHGLSISGSASCVDLVASFMAKVPLAHLAVLLGVGHLRLLEPGAAWLAWTQGREVALLSACNHGAALSFLAYLRMLNVGGTMIGSELIALEAAVRQLLCPKAETPVN